MRKKSLLAVILIYALTVMLSLTFKIQTARADTPIYIRADGSIDPADSPISSADNDTYTFTENINNSIIIQRNNITIDGNGHTIQGSRNETGFTLTNLYNVTIRNTKIRNFLNGIYFDSTSHSTISGNTITESNRSLELYNSANYNAIYGNNMEYNNFSIYMWMHSDHNTITENNITNNAHPASILLAECSDNTITENNITDSRLDSISLSRSTNNTISRNNITNNGGYGIWLSQSSNNTITDNDINRNNKGITISLASNNNTIHANNITSNSAYGIALYQGKNNTITHNNLVANAQHVNISTPNLNNDWDNGLEGNYWSNYTGSDANHDGTGDTAHTLNADNSDNHPLMGMFHTYSTFDNQLVNVVSNSTILNFTYFPLDNTIKLKVTNTADTQTYGFCRITIPHALMNTTNLTVIIDEGITPVLSPNYTLHDNTTHIWIYFAYPHTTHEITIIPELQTISILTLLTTSAILIKITIPKRKTTHPRNNPLTKAL
jgi:parallel beta-helix repeat protein